MKINTKEKYLKTHTPIVPRSRKNRKERRKISGTVKDRHDRVKIDPIPVSIFDNLIPLMVSNYYYTPPTKTGIRIHVAQRRIIFKRQRRREYLRMCRG